MSSLLELFLTHSLSSSSSTSPLNLIKMFSYERYIIQMIFNEWKGERRFKQEDKWYMVLGTSIKLVPVVPMACNVLKLRCDVLKLFRVLNQTIPWDLLSSKIQVTRMDVVPLVPHIHGTKYQNPTLREYFALFTSSIFHLSHSSSSPLNLFYFFNCYRYDCNDF